jgi:hypothetical protein
LSAQAYKNGTPATKIGKSAVSLRRSGHVNLTDEGRDVLVAVLPVWRDTHSEIYTLLDDGSPDRLRTDLLALS